ncbi:MAG TPA: hypothetical protein VKR23_15185 [Gaiellaceae bacterium]|nr:hypothetical protein [Gaiellaceae bacterium]
MSSDEWYRSPGWSDADRDLFEEKLARARAVGRPQYLRIKASALLKTSDPVRRRAGALLLERLLGEYPEERTETAGAHFLLARYHEEDGDVQRAAEHYRDGLREQARTSRRWGAEQEFAELIIRESLAEAYAEADELLDRVLEQGPFFRSQQFRYAVARSRLASLRGAADEAAAFALGALDLFDHNRAVSSYHPNVGLIRADEATLSELESRAERVNAEAFSALVDRYRRPDGTVRWDWSLLIRLRPMPEGSWVHRVDEFQAATEPIIEELRSAGFEVYDLGDWSLRRVRSAAAVKAAASILVRWYDRTESLMVKTEIAMTLTDSRARKLAAGPFIDYFRELKPSDMSGDERFLKDRLGCALATLARDEHFDEIAGLIRDPAHGRYRGYLFWAVPYMKDPAAVDLALEMLGDDELSMSALRALADLRSERGRPYLEAVASEPKPRGRSDADQGARDRIAVAKRGLEKLDKARAAGKSRS